MFGGSGPASVAGNKLNAMLGQKKLEILGPVVKKQGNYMSLHMVCSLQLEELAQLRCP